MIFGLFERFLALRYLGARREGFVSVIAIISLVGIALGVATLIIVMAVMNGFRQELLGRILGVNGHLTVYNYSGAFEGEDLAEQLAALDAVVDVAPQIQGQVMIMDKGRTSGAVVRALSPLDLRERKILADNIKAGSLELFDQGEGILIGREMAQSFGLKVGDRLSLVSPRGNATALGTIPRVRSYPIAALFDVGMYEYDSSFVYMPLEAARRFFDLPGQINAIEVFAEDPERIEDLEVRVFIDAGEGFRVVNWQKANASYFNAIQVERNVMFLILSLIILVAAFNILSGQYMLVKGKSRDIAILRTMGATRGMILRVFFLSGALIGLFGTLAGFGLGLAFAENIETIRQWVQAVLGQEFFPREIYFLTRLPAIVDPKEVVQVVAMGLVLSFLAPLVPAWQAARLDPVDALRYE